MRRSPPAVPCDRPAFETHGGFPTPGPWAGHSHLLLRRRLLGLSLRGRVIAKPHLSPSSKATDAVLSHDVFVLQAPPRSLAGRPPGRRQGRRGRRGRRGDHERSATSIGDPHAAVSGNVSSLSSARLSLPVLPATRHNVLVYMHGPCLGLGHARSLARSCCSLSG